MVVVLLLVVVGLPGDMGGLLFWGDADWVEEEDVDTAMTAGGGDDLLLF